MVDVVWNLLIRSDIQYDDIANLLKKGKKVALKKYPYRKTTLTRAIYRRGVVPMIAVVPNTDWIIIH